MGRGQVTWALEAVAKSLDFLKEQRNPTASAVWGPAEAHLDVADPLRCGEGMGEAGRWGS